MEWNLVIFCQFSFQKGEKSWKLNIHAFEKMVPNEKAAV